MKMKKAKRSLFSDILGSVTKYFVILVVIVLVVTSNSFAEEFILIYKSIFS